ncbi:MAG: PepSY-like domain-containing protein [Bacteroidetes bacterium]|nr:PepSY-like domain-containing protein [Bacteroidota bacterium]
MKKLTTTLALFILLVTAAQAQRLNASKVPAAVKASFEKKYTGIAAKWEKEDGNYEASFTQNGNKQSATFSPDGTFTEVETAITESQLPAGVTAYVKAHYSGKTIKEAAKIIKADGTVNYEAEVNGKDVIFDAGGKFIKEMKD